ncbi:MAG: class I poly(R)-hydroxyalkanoic acid synthase [Burkholderiaceae bacterium]
MAAGGIEAMAATEPLTIDPAEFMSVQTTYLDGLKSLFEHGAQARPHDRRFAGSAWQQSPFGWNAALYELNAQAMMHLASALKGDEKSRERVRFAVQQWVDAMAPTNFLISNPDAQRKLVDSAGKSLQQGVENLLGDLRKGHISQVDESAFEVGRNLAVTPGAVVFENELIQLIQYEPTTPRVAAKPILLVPPCINKFYILDLQPENSLVAHLIDQGHTVFMVSWRNVKADQGTLGWDDYLKLGVHDAIDVVRDISGQDTINALGFCVGGTIIAAALAVLAARGERPVESLTLLTTLLDFERTGILDIFIDEAQVAWREATLGNGGIMPGADLAHTFSMLRPNDLIWNYVVNNYLKGEKPAAFDLLYWNGDSTNLPGPMYTWYLRHTYLQDELKQPGRLTCLGQPVDLSSIGVPTYVYASREDHIVPWQSAYGSTRILDGELRFVLGASGHIAGVINPPAKRKRNYWVNDTLPDSADEWFEHATEVAGSWWPDWCQWLEDHKGGTVTARKPGTADYPVIEPAPGRYVRERA